MTVKFKRLTDIIGITYLCDNFYFFMKIHTYCLNAPAFIVSLINTVPIATMLSPLNK